MFIYNGGTAVEKGMYWSPMDGGRIDMLDSGVLPGDKRRGYLRISPLILLLIAPFFGVTFIFFLPFFGMGVLVVLCILSATIAFSAVVTTAIRVCCGVGDKKALSGKKIFTGAYRPLGASFTGTVKNKKKGSGMK